MLYMKLRKSYLQKLLSMSPLGSRTSFQNIIRLRSRILLSSYSVTRTKICSTFNNMMEVCDKQINLVKAYLEPKARNATTRVKIQIYKQFCKLFYSLSTAEMRIIKNGHQVMNHCRGVQRVN